VSDKKPETPEDKPAENGDQNFIYGDAPAKTKIEAWEGEGEADLVSTQVRCRWRTCTSEPIQMLSS